MSFLWQDFGYDTFSIVWEFLFDVVITPEWVGYLVFLLFVGIFLDFYFPFVCP